MYYLGAQMDTQDTVAANKHASQEEADRPARESAGTVGAQAGPWREIGALAQAARNFLACPSAHEARTLDRLAATALGVQPVQSFWSSLGRDHYLAMEAAAMAAHPDACEHGVRLKNHCATCAAIAETEGR